LNLILDIGNTLVKAASFDKGVLFDLKSFTSIKDLLSNLDVNAPIYKHCIISSVVENKAGLLSQIEFKKAPLWMDAQTKVPIKNDYQSPQTLGSDRLAAAVGANALFPNDTLLNVDTGTCIKYNFVHNGSFLGGAISPGIKMRLQAMHHFTAALPLLEHDNDYNKLIGGNTTESILSGALLGAVAEVDGIIQNYLQKYPQLKVVLSGGDTEFFVKRLKNSTFARPHLVLEGLNTILDYHVES